jgi:CRP-like cAMP-binding protein
MPDPDDTLIDALRASPIGSGLSAEQARMLAGLVEPRDCARDEVLGREGEVDDRLFVVVAGTLAVTRHLGTRTETLLSTLHRGDLAHELGFLDGAPRYASLVASEPSRVLVLRRAALEGLIERDPRLLYAVMGGIVRAVHALQTRLSMQAAELANYVFKQHGRY